MNIVKRIALFARDYCDEFGVAWSLARMRDCERAGGHRWGEPQQKSIGFGHTCSRCGCFESLSVTSGTAATNTTLRLYPQGHA